MWFARKAKNKANERRHVLDVKVARRKLARQRARVASIAAGLSLGTIFCLYFLWRSGDWAMNKFIYQNEVFAIREIDVQTDGIISLEQLRRWAGVRPRQNLFALDLMRVKRDLELVPAIESVAVERILPTTLKIRVTEREPVARLQDYFLDAEGFAMMPLEPQQRSLQLPSEERYPLLTGVKTTDLRAGKQTESPQIRAALRFLTAFDHSPMAALVDIARVDVSGMDVIHVSTSQQNEITFSLSDFDRQLNRWWLVHVRGQEQSRHIGTLDLSVADNVPLRWQEANVVPPAPVKVRKSSPYKKKHV